MIEQYTRSKHVFYPGNGMPAHAPLHAQTFGDLGKRLPGCESHVRAFRQEQSSEFGRRLLDSSYSMGLRHPVTLSTLSGHFEGCI